MDMLRRLISCRIIIIIIIRGLTVLTSVWLRATETEISAAQCAYVARQGLSTCKRPEYLSHNR